MRLMYFKYFFSFLISKEKKWIFQLFAECWLFSVWHKILKIKSIQYYDHQAGRIDIYNSYDVFSSTAIDGLSSYNSRKSIPLYLILTLIYQFNHSFPFPDFATRMDFVVKWINDKWKKRWNVNKNTLRNLASI